MAKKINSRTSGHGQKQTFAFSAPGAVSVQLVGDFTQWQEHPINLQKGAERNLAGNGGIKTRNAPLSFPRGW